MVYDSKCNNEIIMKNTVEIDVLVVWIKNKFYTDFSFLFIGAWLTDTFL